MKGVFYNNMLRVVVKSWFICSLDMNTCNKCVTLWVNDINYSQVQLLQQVPIWSNLLSHNRCYRLQPLLTALLLYCCYRYSFVNVPQENWHCRNKMGTVKNHPDQWQPMCQISFWVWIKTLGCGFTCPTKFLVEDTFLTSTCIPGRRRTLWELLESGK